LERPDRRIATPAPAWPMVKFHVLTTRVIANTMEEPIHSVKHFPRETPATRVLVRLQDRWSAPTKFVDVRTMAFLYKLAPQSLRVMAAMTVHVKTMARWSAPLTLCPANAHTMAIL